MNTAEKYIYHVYRERSFSKAARTMFVSQPSLSATVAGRERELGFQIFDRSTKPISLTPQGQIYVEMLEEIAESERNMQHRIRQLMGDRRNAIAIGGSSSTAYYMMPMICGAFRRRFPEAEVRLDIGSFGAEASLSERFSLNQKLDRGELDAVFCYHYNAAQFSGHTLYEERLIVAMHQSLVTPTLLPYALTRKELLQGHFDESRICRHPEQMCNIPFLAFPPHGSTGQYMTRLLGDYTPSGYTVSNAQHSIVHFNMMRAGTGALMTSDYVVALSAADESLRFFVFDPALSTRKIFLITKRDSPLHPSLRQFIGIARALCRNKNALSFYPPAMPLSPDGSD